MNENDNVNGYEIKRSIIFDNDRGVALAENPRAVQPFVTWMFFEDENGERSYEWGHYTTNRQDAESDYHTRISEYIWDYGVSERTTRPTPETYKYYSTQRPVDIGTFPKFGNEPIRIENFDERIFVEGGAFRAWGYLEYAAPLTDKQIDDYELRAAPNNPDIKAVMEKQAQTVGHWEEVKGLPDSERFTWHKPSIHAFALREPVVTPEKLEHRYNYAKYDLTRTDKIPIAEQLKEGADRAAIDNAALPKLGKSTEKDR